MQARVMGLTILGLAMLVGVSAQTAPAIAQANSLESCRAEAIRRGMSGGDAFAKFMSECTQARSGTPAQRASFDQCRSDAVAAGHVGEARSDYVDQCMARSGAADDSATPGTYHNCRTQARAQRMSGDALNNFLNDCVGK